MRVYEVRCEIFPEYEEYILEETEAIFETLGISGYYSDKSPKSESVFICFSYESEKAYERGRVALEKMLKNYGSPNAEVVILEEEEYLNAYRSALKPILIEESLWIVPYAPSADLEEDGIPRLYIDAHYSFGTGAHATTKCALSLIHRHHKEVDKSLPVIDIGAGSGILSLATSMLGFTDITAIDIDENSPNCIADNAKINSLVVPKTAVGSVDLLLGKTFSLVIMNIETEIILNLLDDTVRLLDENSRLILSGILTERKSEVYEAIKKHSLIVVDEISEGDWSGVCLKRA